MMMHEQMPTLRKVQRPTKVTEKIEEIVPLHNTVAGRRQRLEERLGKIDTGSRRDHKPDNAVEVDEIDHKLEQRPNRLESRNVSARDEGVEDFGTAENQDIRTYETSYQRPRRQQRYDLDALAAEIRVMYRMFPALLLLSHPNILRSETDIREASEHALTAWRLSRELQVSEALQARCAYYVGLAEYFLTEKDERGVPISYSQVGSSGSYESKGVKQTPCVRYFHEARVAKRVYREGDFAEQWLNHFKSAAPQSPTGAQQRPRSSESWSGKMWEWIRGTKEHVESPVLRRPPRPRGREQGERIPDFLSWGSGSASRPVSSRDSGVGQDAEGNISVQDFSPVSLQPSESISQQWQSPPARTILRIANPDPSTSSVTSTTKTRNVPQALLNSPTSKSAPALTPQTSPTFVATASHVRSATISSAEGLQTGISNAENKPSSIYQRRRKPSLLALVTGRERQPSELKRMEEGQSPRRGTFAGLEDGGGGGGGMFGGGFGLKKRKKAEADDLV